MVVLRTVPKNICNLLLVRTEGKKLQTFIFLTKVPFFCSVHAASALCPKQKFLCYGLYPTANFGLACFIIKDRAQNDVHKGGPSLLEGKSTINQYNYTEAQTIIASSDGSTFSDSMRTANAIVNYFETDVLEETSRSRSI